MFVGAPTLKQPASQICTAAQFAEDDYTRLADLIQQPPRLHRKQWEYVYILRVLEACGMLKADKTGLGFGCGVEPVAAVMALSGMSVRVTERPGYTTRDMNPAEIAAIDLFYGGICTEDMFKERVTFSSADMNHIPAESGPADVVWACSVIEELGSIQAGADAVIAATQHLKSGGIAVFTTQFNAGSDTDTIERPELSVWRRLDVLNLQARALEARCEMLPLCLVPGALPEDMLVDTPPYGSAVHLKMSIDSNTVTSLGFALRKL